MQRQQNDSGWQIRIQMLSNGGSLVGEFSHACDTSEQALESLKFAIAASHPDCDPLLAGQLRFATMSDEEYEQQQQKKREREAQRQMQAACQHLYKEIPAHLSDGWNRYECKKCAYRSKVLRQGTLLRK